MDSIADFISKDKRIEELEKMLLLATKNVAQWKCKYWKLAKKNGMKKPATRSEKAVNLIKEDNNLKLKDIADKCFLSLGHVNDLSSEVNRGLR